MVGIIDNTNLVFSIFTIISQLIILLIIFSKINEWNKINRFFGKNALLFSFLVALGSMLGSLFYSNILGFEPCRLCWYQRIFMYPQVLFLGLALWKDKFKTNVKAYAIIFSVMGVLISIYQYLNQIGLLKAASCNIGESVRSCSATYVQMFGYITIPMMALTGFLMIIVFMLGFKRKKD